MNAARARVQLARMAALALVRAALCAAAVTTTVAVTAPAPARAQAPAAPQPRVDRYALIVGNDQGRAAEPPLRYAAADAQKVYDVLRDLGGFEPKDMVLLSNESAATARSTLIALNDRIRASLAQPERKSLLFVYYSGHADAESLHLGGTDLPIEELGQLVRGSAASFRLLVLDACRSGALTRVKGGTIAEPFPLGDARTAALHGEGLAFMTASSSTEDAQESDEIAGSLFTHAFVSGLMGAADRDGDGAVVLEEAYRYAYDATLRLTSRTRGGLQHPTFRYDYRGQGGLVLTTPHAHGGRRGLLHLPRGIGFVLLRDETGPVVAELGAGDPSRSLSLRAGRYLALGRGADYLLERALELHADQSLALERADFERVEYDRLVRKGGGARPSAHALELGARLRSALPNATRACPGMFVGYGLDLRAFSLQARLGACASGFDSPNADLRDADSNELDLELRLLHAWDLPLVTLHAGAGAGGALFMQRFESAGRAPARDSAALAFHAAAGASLALFGAYYATLDASVQAYLFELRSSTTQRASLRGAFAFRSALGIGRRF